MPLRFGGDDIAPFEGVSSGRVLVIPMVHQQLSLAFGTGTACTKAFQIKTFFTVSSRTAQPIRDPVPHKHKEVPALRFAPAGMTVVLVWFYIWTRFGDPLGPPNRFEYRFRAMGRVKSPANTRIWPLGQAGPAPKPSRTKEREAMASPMGVVQAHEVPAFLFVSAQMKFWG